MSLIKMKLGDLIQQRREKFDGKLHLPIRGITREGFTKAKIPDANTSIYNVFYLNDFVFNPARMEINSIVFNDKLDRAICSSLYEIFFVTRTDLILPEYLNLFIKRDEFARECEFIGWGSAREYCRFENLADVSIDLPPINIQRKYVAIYEAMLANQRLYEQGLNDLKLACDAFIEELKHKYPSSPIGPYIEQKDLRNEKGFGEKDVRGISVDKELIVTKAKLDGVSLHSYKVVNPHDLVYVADTSRRGNKISIALNETDTPCIVSSISTVFSVKDPSELLPEYLMLFFNRSEFDRRARFCSWGSARETFDWDEMCNVSIPIPDIAIQNCAVQLYRAWRTRMAANELLKKQLKEICPVLIRGSIEEASH